MQSIKEKFKQNDRQVRAKLEEFKRNVPAVEREHDDNAHKKVIVQMKAEVKQAFLKEAIDYLNQGISPEEGSI